MYLLDTNIVSELRCLHPSQEVVNWIEDVPAEQLYLCADTIGEIQAGVEITREQDTANAEELEAWLNQVLASYNALKIEHADSRCHDRSCRHRPSADCLDPKCPRLPTTRRPGAQPVRRP